MRITTFALWGIAMVLCASTAYAQQSQGLAQRTTFDYFQQDDQPSPSDIRPPATTDAPPTVSSSAPDMQYAPSFAGSGCCDGIGCDGIGCDGGCDGGGGSCCNDGGLGGLHLGRYTGVDRLRCCDLGEPWTLFGESCSGITAGGWFQFGYTNYDNGQFNNHPYSLDLNQAWIYSEKQADGRCGWDWGYRIDYVYGTDGPDTQAFGGTNWDTQWDAGGFYGHAIPQLYAEVANGDLSIKIGHFFTIIGYEVVPSPGNFFYSHSFTMFNAEPFTHTGALAEYQWNDVTFWGGYVMGWDTGFERNGGDAFLGGISAPLTDDITLTYATTAGKIGQGTNVSGYSHSVVFDVALLENLNYVFQSDLTSYSNVNEAIGINQYLIHKLSDCVSHGIRVEWLQLEDNAGNDQDLYEVTYGFNLRPHANVLVRPEVRWDKDDAGVVIPAAHNERVGVGIDAILTF